MIFPVLINTSIFIFLSFLHVYWAMGGTRGTNAVIPVLEGDDKPFEPGPLMTLAVAAGLGLFAFIMIGNLDIFKAYVSLTFFKYATLVIGIIFTLRAIGDFKYIGFFKKTAGTLFAKNDTRYYSPLCLAIAFFCYLIFLIG